jgi:endonuclease-3
VPIFNGISNGKMKKYLFCSVNLLNATILSVIISRLFEVLNKFYGSKTAWLEVEEELRKVGKIISFDDFYDPFKNLVIGILSQNTSDRNSTRAYINLVKKFGKITPEILAKAPLGKIKNAIKCGGLYNLKAKRLKKLARIILEKYDGNLTKIMKLPERKVRMELLNLPGIGPKTVDVFIGYCMKKNTLPIDTNIKRVAKRVGIVSADAKYAEIQKALSRVLPLKQRLKGHELLIRLGRDFCKVRNPLCKECPLKLFCKKHF